MNETNETYEPTENASSLGALDNPNLIIKADSLCLTCQSAVVTHAETNEPEMIEQIFCTAMHAMTWTISKQFKMRACSNYALRNI